MVRVMVNCTAGSGVGCGSSIFEQAVSIMAATKREAIFSWGKKVARWRKNLGGPPRQFLYQPYEQGPTPTKASFRRLLALRHQQLLPQLHVVGCEVV